MGGGAAAAAIRFGQGLRTKAEIDNVQLGSVEASWGVGRDYVIRHDVGA